MTEPDDVGILVCTFDKDERTEFLVYVNDKPEEWVRPGNSVNQEHVQMPLSE